MAAHGGSVGGGVGGGGGGGGASGDASPSLSTLLTTFYTSSIDAATRAAIQVGLPVGLGGRSERGQGGRAQVDWCRCLFGEGAVWEVTAGLRWPRGAWWMPDPWRDCHRTGGGDWLGSGPCGL